MSQLKKYQLPLSIFLVWLFTISGIIGITLGHKEWFITKTPLNLLVLFGLLALNFKIDTTKKLSLTLIFFIIGFIIEWVGVHYSFPFGAYYYGNNLGFKIDGIPPLIGINWALLTLSTAAIAQHLAPNKILRSSLAAGLMVGLDFLIEPLAPVFDFWHWSLGHAPLQNFIGWFVVAWVLQWLYVKSQTKGHFAISLQIYIAQFVFFLYFYIYGV